MQQTAKPFVGIRRLFHMQSQKWQMNFTYRFSTLNFFFFLLLSNFNQVLIEEAFPFAHFFYSFETLIFRIFLCEITKWWSENIYTWNKKPKLLENKNRQFLTAQDNKYTNKTWVVQLCIQTQYKSVTINTIIMICSYW